MHILGNCFFIGFRKLRTFWDIFLKIIGNLFWLNFYEFLVYKSTISQKNKNRKKLFFHSFQNITHLFGPKIQFCHFFSACCSLEYIKLMTNWVVLDILVAKENNLFMTYLYRKPIKVFQWSLIVRSHLYIKINLINSLLDRAYKIS